MPTPRKPLEAHLRDGTYRHDRHGPIPDDVQTFTPPRKPADLVGDAGEFWDTITALLAGVVRDRDAPLLAELCWHWSELRRVKKVLATKQPGEAGYNTLLVAVGILTDKFDKIASRFGLTPADPARLNVEVAAPVKARVATRPRTKLDKMGKPDC